MFWLLHIVCINYVVQYNIDVGYIAPPQAALVVSVLNIQIPLEMGRLVNVVAGFTPGGSLGTYLERLSLPALHLCALYLTQVCPIPCL